ncbi:MAG: hypothetical protein P8M05_13180 [Flavobacteriales bacterium]|nr:hypothetical protein [Flavobacteriales bacterium]
MYINQKAAMYSTILVGLYGLASYLMFTYAFSSILTTILTIPLSLAFIVGYGMGDFMGYLSLALMVLLIWYVSYLIIKRNIKKASA